MNPGYWFSIVMDKYDQFFFSEPWNYQFVYVLGSKLGLSKMLSLLFCHLVKVVLSVSNQHYSSSSSFFALVVTVLIHLKLLH